MQWYIRSTQVPSPNVVFTTEISEDFADLPSEVILMREISAGVPINDPIAPAVIPV